MHDGTESMANRKIRRFELSCFSNFRLQSIDELLLLVHRPLVRLNLKFEFDLFSFFLRFIRTGIINCLVEFI